MELITNQYKFKIIRNRLIDSFDKSNIIFSQINVFNRYIVSLIAIKNIIDISIISAIIITVQ